VTVGGLPLSGVEMTGLPGDPCTDAGGNYSVQVNCGWSGTVTPQKDCYSFNPPSTIYSNVSSNQTGDYTATLLMYTISGTVTVGGLPLSGVEMTGLPGDPCTDAGGNYSVQVNCGWSGTVTPQKDCYSFNPPSRTYSNVSSNLTDQDYTATLLMYTLTINIVGCGSVDKEPPNKATYYCGETVELTAIACDGWTFDSWSGDLTGNNNPETILMNGNKTVTVTFTEEGCGPCDGQTYEWTNAYTWSYLWVDPLNWDPTAPYGGPGVADTAIIRIGSDPVPPGEDPPGPILDTEIDICRIYGPAHDANGQQTMYVIKDADVEVCEMWDSHPVVPGIGTIIIGDAARVRIYGWHRLADHGTIIEQISGGADVFVGDYMKGGDNSDGRFELTVTDDASLYVDDILMIGDDGSGFIDLSGNANVSCNRFKLQVRPSAATAELNVSGNAMLEAFSASEYGIRICDGDGTATMNMNGGIVVSASELTLANSEGTGILNMTDGLITVAGAFEVPGDDDSTAIVEHLGGVIECHEFTHAGGDDAPYSYHICGGTLVIDGDVVADVQHEVDLGKIYACGEVSCDDPERICSRGDVLIEYDTPEFPLRTKVTASYHPERAWCPTPENFATDVPSLGTELCWCMGEPEGGVKLQHVWFSTDYATVANRDPSAFLGQVWPQDHYHCIDPGPLCLCTTYYWAVDTQDHYTNIYRGLVWQFTVECCRAIEDMEAYTLEPDYIYDTWWDGCGDANGMYGNGTGSCVNLTMENTHGGAKAMLYTYEAWLNSPWERDANYSEAMRTFDPPLDLTTACEAALVVWFYGNRDNGSTQMWVLLNSDGTFPNNDIVGMATYGDYGDDPEDIKKEEWIDWNMKLSDFAAAGKDLSNVTSLSIGFGPKLANEQEPGIQGIVLFDDIAVCPVRCVPKYTPDICDLNADCVVDMKDVGVIAEAWLEDGRCSQ